MTIEEALEVYNSVHNDTHPPTNPAVLLGAARTIYLNQDQGFTQAQIVEILIWTLNVMALNSPTAFSQSQRELIITLDFTRAFTHV